MYRQNSLDDDFINSFQKISVRVEDVNILLLGETGVGKSTFINAFANYLEYKTFDIAEQNRVRCLIPAKFTVTTENNFEEKVVQIGSDDNENATMSASATMETRSYVFPLNRDGINRIRLIDTPGIGDTRGIDKDNENMENILAYISNLKEIHAICFLLKPNNARLTVMFHYCIKQLLSRLEKSASKNIIFLFTNTRSTFYKPGDTIPALKNILRDIESRPPHVDIKFEKDNVFCLDNESFRYLVAVKDGIELGNRKNFTQSWDNSVQECWRMIHFITGNGNFKIKMTPHKVKDTLSVNEARRVILQLSKPLADIAELINDNLTALDRHNKSLKIENRSISDLKANLYVPVVNLRVQELKEPTTVCTAAKCSEIYTVRNIQKYHYKQRCHDPCYLQNVPKEIIGSPELLNCWAISGNKCKICQCDFSTHMHIYYISETFDDKIDNEGVKAQIKDRETALEQTRKMIATIEAIKLDYEEEKETIIKTMAKFAHFLQRNAIAAYNDSYQGYIEYLIDREKSKGSNCDFQVVNYHEELLMRYAEEKRILENALSSSSGIHSAVTAQTVFESVQELYDLPYTGQQIRDLHSKHTSSHKKEHKNTEIVLDAAQKDYANSYRNKKQHGKPKNRKPPQYQNTTKNKKFNKGQRDPKQRNVPYQGHDNYHRQFNPQTFPETQYYQNQGGAGYSGHPQSYQDPHGNLPNQNLYGGPSSFQNYNEDPSNSQNYQQNNYQSYPPHSKFQNQQGFNQNAANYSGMSGKGSNGDYDEWMQNSAYFGNTDESISAVNNNRFGKGSGSTTNNGFDDWVKGLSTNNTNTNTSTMRSNNFRTRENFSEDESDDSNKLPQVDDDDEDFTQFMANNNLEYFAKSTNKSYSSNINRPQQSNTSTYSYGSGAGSASEPVTVLNQGQQYQPKNTKGVNKVGMLKRLYEKFI